MTDTTQLPKTILLDIDGCLVNYVTNFSDIIAGYAEPYALPGTVDTLMKWHNQGHKIILTTGRPECTRKRTEDMLTKCGILYDMLIMGLGPGPRVLINDMDPRQPETPKSMAVNIVRNLGFKDVDLDAVQDYPHYLIEKNNAK